MIVNVLKNFSFNKEEERYEVDYLFSNNLEDNIPKGLSLTLNVSLNGADKKHYKISKPTSILYLSNEDIEKIIREDMVAF